MKMLAYFLLILMFFVAVPETARAADNEGELSPGDKGFKHEELHPYYQKLFSGGGCFCKSGECRPTVYRTSKESPSGIEVKINGGWYPVPKSALRNKNYIPPELWGYPAHVCAYPSDATEEEYFIECAVINSGV